MVWSIGENYDTIIRIGVPFEQNLHLGKLAFIPLQMNARSRFYLSYSKSGMNREKAPL